MKSVASIILALVVLAASAAAWSSVSEVTLYIA